MMQMSLIRKSENNFFLINFKIYVKLCKDMELTCIEKGNREQQNEISYLCSIIVMMSMIWT